MFLCPGDLVVTINDESVWRVTSSQARDSMARAELAGDTVRWDLVPLMLYPYHPHVFIVHHHFKPFANNQQKWEKINLKVLIGF